MSEQGEIQQPTNYAERVRNRLDKLHESGRLPESYMVEAAQLRMFDKAYRVVQPEIQQQMDTEGFFQLVQEHGVAMQHQAERHQKWAKALSIPNLVIGAVFLGRGIRSGSSIDSMVGTIGLISGAKGRYGNTEVSYAKSFNRLGNFMEKHPKFANRYTERVLKRVKETGIT